MLKHILLSAIIMACPLSINAQSDTLYFSDNFFSSSVVLNQHNMAKWNIPAGNYSGITHIAGNRYAVVTDKPKQNGFYEFSIDFSESGDIISMKNLGFHFESTSTNNNLNSANDNRKAEIEKIRDSEGIVFSPLTNTVFISAESDQQVIEYDLNGSTTGRKLEIPECFGPSKITGNYGFESLGYSPSAHLFWTTTENALPSDINNVNATGNKPAILRLQSFTEDLKPYRQYAYKTDAPQAATSKHKLYCFGVPEITALDDGSLLILEREFFVAPSYIGSFVENRIYHVNPVISASIQEEESIDNLPDFVYLSKSLVAKFNTNITNIANYEGMCLGPVLADGTQTLIVISDSQDNYGNSFYHLKDWIRVILLK